MRRPGASRNCGRGARPPDGPAAGCRSRTGVLSCAMFIPRWLSYLGCAAVLAGCSTSDGPTDSGFDDDPYPYPVGKVFFSHPPVGLEGVFFFESMGALFTPYQEDHGGFFHHQLGPDEPTIPVIAPADGQVIEIRTHEGTIDGREHAVRLQISTTIQLLWGHVGRLADRLAPEAGPLGSSRDVRIPVEAGEVIGYVARTALDLAVNDLDIETRILHPDFRGVNPHAAPLEEYYHEPLRTRIRDLTIRETEPRTGQMGYDVAGTLSGLWYLDGSDPRGPEFREDIAFHFGYHHLVTHRTNILDGLAYVDETLGATGNQLWSLWIKNSPRWEDITPASGMLKLEMFPSSSGLGSWPDVTLEDTSGLDETAQTESILLVEMLDHDTVRLERFDAPDASGISPDDVTDFTVNARTYHRNPVG